jgi:hypothetical protein
MKFASGGRCASYSSIHASTTSTCLSANRTRDFCFSLLLSSGVATGASDVHQPALDLGESLLEGLERGAKRQPVQRRRRLSEIRQTVRFVARTGPRAEPAVAAPRLLHERPGDPHGDAHLVNLPERLEDRVVLVPALHVEQAR